MAHSHVLLVEDEPLDDPLDELLHEEDRVAFDRVELSHALFVRVDVAPRLEAALVLAGWVDRLAPETTLLEVLVGPAFQMVHTSSPSASSVRLVMSRPPLPLELTDEEDQMGVRDPITTNPPLYASPEEGPPMVFQLP